MGEQAGMELFNGVIGGIALYAWFRLARGARVRARRAAGPPRRPPTPDDNTFAKRRFAQRAPHRDM